MKAQALRSLFVRAVGWLTLSSVIPDQCPPPR